MKQFDISTENWREYEYEDGYTVRIENPETLYYNEGKSESHRVEDKDGVTHYIVPGWRQLRWNGGCQF